MKWADVLTCLDLDEAVKIFTQKLNEIYNQHAPWTVYQKRKNHAPWIMQELKDLMRERDKWKGTLSTLNLSHHSIFNEEKQHAVDMFKYFRNKVNNKKKYDELHYKRQRFKENKSSN